MASSTGHDPADNGSEKGAAVEQPMATTVDSAEGGSERQAHVHAKTWFAVFSICLIYFTQTFSVVGAGAQGVIISTHFGRPGDTIWIAGPITIFVSVFSPIITQAADYWGRKWFLVILTLFGPAGAIVVARATNMNMVMAGFNLIAIAFTVQALLNAVLSEVLPRRWRPWAQAFGMIANALSLISSLIVAGLLNRYGNPDGWRNYHWIVMAQFALAAIICVFAYRPPPRELQTMYSFREKMARLDWIGYILLASSLVLFCMGLAWSQNPYEWTDPHPSAPFAIGVALGLGLILYEVKFKSDGMFHHGLFNKDRNFAITLFLIFCEGVAFFAANIYFVFQVSVLYETDFLLVCTRFAIAFVATTVAAVVIGWYCALTKTIRWPTFHAFAIFTVFFVCMATTNKDTSRAVWGYAILLGWPFGVTLITVVTAAQLSTPPDLIAIATGLVICIRAIGGAIAITIFNAVFFSATKDTAGNVANAAIKAGLPTNSVEQFVGAVLSNNRTYLAQVPQNIVSAGVDAFLDTYTHGFRNVWISSIPFVVLAAIASVFLIDPKKEFNNRVDAPVEKEEELYAF